VHFDELAALPRACRRTKQKARQAVPAVLKRRSAATESAASRERRRIQRRNRISKSKRAARAGAQFRLPVVHQMVEEVEAKPYLVSALHPACIGIERVGLVVAEQWIPSF